MKKIVIILFIVVVIGIIATKYFKKIRDVGKLDIGIKSFYFVNDKLNSINGIFELLGNLSSLSLPAIIEIEINNLSASTYTIQNLYVEVYSKTGVLIAKPDKLITDKIKILPGAKTIIKIPYTIDLLGLKALATSLSNSNTISVQDLLLSYVTTKKIGTQINLIGYLNAEGITVLDIPINETIDI